MTDKKIKFGAAGTTYGLDMLYAHCATVNSYKWVRESGKRYVVVQGEDGRHFIDFRKVPNASEHGARA